jgi:hypothetical protein
MWYLPATTRNHETTAIRNSGSVPVETVGCEGVPFKQQPAVDSCKWPTWRTYSFFVYFYSKSLHDSSTHVLIIRKINCINTTSGICHSILVTVWYAGLGSTQTCILDGHQHRVTVVLRPVCRIMGLRFEEGILSGCLPWPPTPSHDSLRL